MSVIIGFVVGIPLGFYFDPTVPDWLQPFLPVAVIAGLDVLFDAARAWLKGAFHDRIFITSFFWNVVAACLPALMGS